MRPGLPGTVLLLAGSFLVTFLFLTWGGNSSESAAPSALVVAQPETGLAAGPAPSLLATAAPIHADPDAGMRDDIPDIATAMVDATRALDPEDRILAIQVLADDSSRESFDTLLTTVTAGADPRERATAIASLGQRQRDDGDDLLVGHAMRAALNDPDPLVVVLAQTALEEIEPAP